MRYFKAGLAVVGVVWMMTMAAALFWYLAPSPNLLGLRTSASADAGVHSAGSLGKRRHLMLVEATRRYSQSGGVTVPGAAEGTAFAPVPFLNRELQRQGAKWRVRSTDGLDAEIYEIS